VSREGAHRARATRRDHPLPAVRDAVGLVWLPNLTRPTVARPWVTVLLSRALCRVSSDACPYRRQAGQARRASLLRLPLSRGGKHAGTARSTAALHPPPRLYPPRPRSKFSDLRGLSRPGAPRSPRPQPLGVCGRPMAYLQLLDGGLATLRFQLTPAHWSHRPTPLCGARTRRLLAALASGTAAPYGAC
jgi:hypothetical protein